MSEQQTLDSATSQAARRKAAEINRAIEAGEQGAESTSARIDEQADVVPEPTVAEKQASDNVERQAEINAALEKIQADGGIGSTETMIAPFTPKDFAEAWKIAHYISESGVVAGNLSKNPGGCFAVMAFGALLGFHPIVAVQKLYVIPQKGGGNKVGLPADMMAAICEADPEFEYFEVAEATDTYATVEAKKHRWPEARQYKVTIEEAIRAGYLDGSHSQLWGKVKEDGTDYPKGTHRRRIMLGHMAVREAARLWNKKRLAGVYTPDEISGGHSPAMAVSGAGPAAQLPAASKALEGAGKAEEGKPTPDTPEPAEEADVDDHRAALHVETQIIESKLNRQAVNAALVEAGIIKGGQTFEAIPPAVTVAECEKALHDID